MCKALWTSVPMKHTIDYQRKKGAKKVTGLQGITIEFELNSSVSLNLLNDLYSNLLCWDNSTHPFKCILEAFHTIELTTKLTKRFPFICMYCIPTSYARTCKTPFTGLWRSHKENMKWSLLIQFVCDIFGKNVSCWDLFNSQIMPRNDMLMNWFATQFFKVHTQRNARLATNGHILCN